MGAHAIWKKGVKNEFAIDLGPEDIYGIQSDTWDVYIKSADEVITDVKLKEAIKTIDDPATTTASEDTAKGSDTIKVDDASNFKKGMVVKIGDYYYYVNAVDTDNNVLTLRKPLKADVKKDDEIKQVGNTGLYGNAITLDKTGIYWIVISNPSIDLMNEVIKVEVVEHNEDDIYNKLEKIEEELLAQNRLKVRLLA